MLLNRQSGEKRAIIAIPAHNEQSQIERCLAALAVQRDSLGAPVPRGHFEILVFANNCSDDTAAIANRYASTMPHTVIVIEEEMHREKLNAGWARKRAMDLAANRMSRSVSIDGVILTTDADSCVSPTWFSANMRELAAGADCVAGYIDANPTDIMSLGYAFLERGRLEDTYLRLIAEIYARCDPRSHDPWPNHRVSSGASLAITLPAYSAIGGLPPRALGEDTALTAALDRAGFRVRHSMDACVSTSCRLDGRAQGGAADTMRHRHAVPDAPCDDEIEAALRLTRRAIFKGMSRKIWRERGNLTELSSRIQIPAILTSQLSAFDDLFDDAWDKICSASPLLQRRPALRPSELPRQIEIAERIVSYLRSSFKPPRNVRDDRRRHELSFETAAG